MNSDHAYGINDLYHTECIREDRISRIRKVAVVRWLILAHFDAVLPVLVCTMYIPERMQGCAMEFAPWPYRVLLYSIDNFTEL